MSQQPLESLGNGAAGGRSPIATTGLLLCGLCCRKTNEDVSKLCVCGMPLHPSCSDDVAVRECELAYGFPDAAGFCSKRCYETDLLAHQTIQQQHSHQHHTTAAADDADHDDGSTRLVTQLAHDPKLPKRMANVPNDVTAVLTIKIGDAGKTSRRHLAVATFRFLLSEGFEVFQAKVNSRTTKELAQQQSLHSSTETAYVRDDRAIYIKPGVHSKQAELVQLTDKNFETRIARSFRNFLKRKTTTSAGDCMDGFACDVLTYVRKDSSSSSSSRRRAGVVGGNGGQHGQLSAVKSTSQLHSLMEFTEQQQQQHAVAAMEGASPAAAAAASDIAASLASTTGGGSKRRFAQMLLSDANASRSESPLDASSNAMPSLLDTDVAAGYRTVRMVLNGAVVPVKVNVRDLLACFGIPSAPSASGDDAGVGMQDL